MQVSSGSTRPLFDEISETSLLTTTQSKLNSIKKSFSSTQALYETVHIRAMGSIALYADPEQILDKILDLLDMNTPNMRLLLKKEPIENLSLHKISDERLARVLDYFGIPLGELSHIELKRFGTLGDLLEYIYEIKGQPGLDLASAYRCSITILSSFLRKHSDSLTPSQLHLMESMRDQFQVCAKQVPQLLDIMIAGIYARNYPGNETVAKRLDNIVCKMIASMMEEIQVSSDSETGYFLAGGSPNHYVQARVLKHGDGYFFQVANEGAGILEFHEPSSDATFEEFSALCFKPITSFYIPDDETLRKVLKKTILAMQTGNRIAIQAPNMGRYYQAFADLQEYAFPGLPPRPKQSVGNCGLRSQLEMIYFILQLVEETPLANRLQTHIIESYQNYPHVYPALKDAILLQQNKAKKEGFVKKPILEMNSFAMVPVENVQKALRFLGYIR